MDLHNKSAIYESPLVKKKLNQSYHGISSDS